MFSTYICSVFSFQRKVVHKPTTANMFGNKLFLWLCWKYSIFKRSIHTLITAKTVPIYTNLTKCQNYLKCKCKRSRLHPTEPIGISGFYAPFINKELKLSDRIWTCKSCGSINDRDILAANNILKFALNPKNKKTDGMSGLACGDVGVSQVNEAGTVSGRSLRS